MYRAITFFTLLSATLLYTHRAQCTFGNEYVHIKVHLPKEHAPVIVEAESPRKVIHHYHHHKSKPRPHAPKKPSVLQSPLLESVILSELDKPLHANEHVEYLNHAKELAEHISKPVETYVIKKQPPPPPPPPPPPKKTVNTYTVIEEKIKPVHEHQENYAHVDTYKVIDTKLPIQQHQHSHHHHDHEDHDYAYKQVASHRPHYDESDGDYNSGYRSEQQQHYHDHHEHRAPYTRHQYGGGGGYAEPAPVEEAPESDDDDFGFQPYQSQQQQQQHFDHYSHQTRYASKQRAPLETLGVPEEDAGADYYYGGGGGGGGGGVADTGSITSSGYSYNQRPTYSAGGAGLGSFRPSPQIVYDAQKSAYSDDTQTGGYLPTTRRPTHVASYSRPLAPEIDWPEPPGYNTGAAETYSGIDSYSVGHVQGIDNGGYQYASPYA